MIQREHQRQENQREKGWVGEREWLCCDKAGTGKCSPFLSFPSDPYTQEISCIQEKRGKCTSVSLGDIFTGVPSEN